MTTYNFPDKVIQNRLGYLRVDCGESEAGDGLAADDATQTTLVLYDAVWHTHLSAQSGQEHDDLKSKRRSSNI